jgi:hypothetical protein
VKRIGLSEADLQAFTNDLKPFHTRYSAFLQRENAAADELRSSGKTIEDAWVKASLARRDAIVQQTRDLMKSDLSADGLQLLDQYVQGEKAGMKIVSIAGQ